mmetsp:Transcript_9359/g.28372  ORF Transcript_9359/g.28372 Transcript_9359/m.28372 type:complete len:116 (+) Transcript_9359:767-1114(+)
MQATGWRRFLVASCKTSIQASDREGNLSWFGSMQLLVCAHTQGRVSRGLPIPQVRMACWDRLLATACELAFLSLRRSFISLSMARKGKEGTNTFIGKTSPVSGDVSCVSSQVAMA